MHRLPSVFFKGGKCTILAEMESSILQCPLVNGTAKKYDFESQVRDEDDNSRSSEEQIERQFNILDEINEKSSDSEHGSDDSLSYDSDLPEDEIEAMLEEGLPDQFKIGKKRKRTGIFITKHKMF